MLPISLARTTQVDMKVLTEYSKTHSSKDERKKLDQEFDTGLAGVTFDVTTKDMMLLGVGFRRVTLRESITEINGKKESKTHDLVQHMIDIFPGHFECHAPLVVEDKKLQSEHKKKHHLHHSKSRHGKHHHRHHHHRHHDGSKRRSQAGVPPPLTYPLVVRATAHHNGKEMTHESAPISIQKSNIQRVLEAARASAVPVSMVGPSSLSDTNSMVANLQGQPQQQVGESLPVQFSRWYGSQSVTVQALLMGVYGVFMTTILFMMATWLVQWIYRARYGYTTVQKKEQHQKQVVEVSAEKIPLNSSPSSTDVESIAQVRMA